MDHRVRSALCFEALHECHRWLNAVDLCSLGVVQLGTLVFGSKTRSFCGEPSYMWKGWNVQHQALSDVKNSVSHQTRKTTCRLRLGHRTVPTRASAWCTFPAADGHRERVAGRDGCQVCVFLFSLRPHSLWVWFWCIARTISRISDSITRSSPR